MRLNRANERRGVILMVVLSLLTLFAIVGISFVLYADAEATSCRIAREGETQQRADVPAEEALAFFLSQFIYDVPDTAVGAGSALRGHSLARTMYGYNYPTSGAPAFTPISSTASNLTAFNGPGRMHYTQPTLNVDDYSLVNYTWFSWDGFLRDPERYGQRLNAQVLANSQPSPYIGGNASYTYPDLNSFFLAAVRSDGTVLTPSYHRPWLFNPGLTLNNMTNPNWTSPAGKYMTLRPRPAEHPLFPYPDDATGDVKNLVSGPGGNDSIWMDINAPVMTAPDGTKYKMLVAPLIMDLDNRINLGASGNIGGFLATPATASRSNQGWFGSEINLSYLFNSTISATAPTEWLNLFNGYGTYYGKYGSDKVPNGALFLPVGLNGSLAHVYSQTDLDGRNESTNPAGNVPGTATTGIQLPAVGSLATPFSCFPYFPPGYGSGSLLEQANHPAKYAVYKSAFYTSTNDDHVFRPSDMEALLRPNSLGQTTVDTGSSALISRLLRLCPSNLGSTDATALQRRNWMTTVSSDLASPGLSPWIYNPSTPALPTTSTYLVNPLTPSLPPVGNNFLFPALTSLGQPLPVGSDFTANWQALYATQALGVALGRLDLNRPLPPFPHMSEGATLASIPIPNGRYDIAAGSVMAPGVMAQFQLAMTARQQLAIDIYIRLLAVTGVAPPSNLAVPLPADLAPRRWLAQLAANIVDYIDADEISTPFNFYNPAIAPYGLPTVGNYNYQVTPTNSTVPINGLSDLAPYYPNVGGNPGVPAYWVFGTELPRVVINEVLGEYLLPTNNANPPTAQSNGAGGAPPYSNVNIFVELFNPMPTPASVTGLAATNQTALQPLDSTTEALYMPASGVGTTPYNPYQLVICNNNLTANANGLWMSTVGGTNNNVLGNPQQARYAVSPTPAAPAGVPAGCNFGAGIGEVYAGMAATVAAPAALNYSLNTAGLPGQSYMLVGPSAADLNADITVAAGVPGTTPFVITPNMTYQVITTYTPPAGGNPAADTWQITTPPPPGSPPNTPTGLLPVTDNANGASVLLRRLANPHLPPNPFTSAGTLLYPAMPPNPYVTIDYAQIVILNGYGLGNNKPVRVTTFNPPLTDHAGNLNSFGKLQPYASAFSQYITQAVLRPPMGGVEYHSLGLPNQPLATPFSWLVHLDRKLISPMELLHVSGFTPHLLTQRFIIPGTIGGAANTQLVPQPYNTAGAQIYNPAGGLAQGVVVGSAYFQHYAPWFDQTRRLYRFFEMVETHDGSSGVSPINGRVPGKININTLWDPPATYPQIYNAIADPPSVTANANNPNFTSAQVQTLFQSLLVGNVTNWPIGNPASAYPFGRTPGLAQTPPQLSAYDRPFVGMAAGMAFPPAVPATSPLSPQSTDPQFPNGMGINHTLLTDGQLDSNALPTNQRLLQLTNALANTAPNYFQGAHPYLQNELLTKIYNRLTTRSNVFAVFLTVGFFEVVTANGVTVTVNGSSIPQLGAEIGRSEGRQIRHRMFAIVDRTNLQAFPSLLSSSIVAAPANLYTLTTATVALSPPPGVTVTGGINPTTNQPLLNVTNPYTGVVTAIQPGTLLTIEPGTANEETVTVTSVIPPGAGVSPQFTANFTLLHPNSAVTGNTTGSYAIAQRGNPGPWMTRYDPRFDPGVVLYWNIID